jgi:hypothetical protein
LENYGLLKMYYVGNVPIWVSLFQQQHQCRPTTNLRTPNPSAVPKTTQYNPSGK